MVGVNEIQSPRKGLTLDRKRWFFLTFFEADEERSKEEMICTSGDLGCGGEA